MSTDIHNIPHYVDPLHEITQSFEGHISYIFQRLKPFNIIVCRFHM